MCGVMCGVKRDRLPLRYSQSTTYFGWARAPLFTSASNAASVNSLHRWNDSRAHNHTYAPWLTTRPAMSSFLLSDTSCDLLYALGREITCPIWCVMLCSQQHSESHVTKFVHAPQPEPCQATHRASGVLPLLLPVRVFPWYEGMETTACTLTLSTLQRVHPRELEQHEKVPSLQATSQPQECCQVMNVKELLVSIACRQSPHDLWSMMDAVMSGWTAWRCCTHRWRPAQVMGMFYSCATCSLHEAPTPEVVLACLRRAPGVLHTDAPCC